MTGQRVGSYEIVRVLARGGMAVVYLAHQPALDRDVALKQLDLDIQDVTIAQRFVREARLAAGLDHPNVVTLFDFFEHAGVPYIAMEYVSGGSLRPLVGDLRLPQIFGVLEGVLNGLGHAEERSIAHRDLKPENVLVTGRGGVKIADFGIARAYNALDRAPDEHERSDRHARVHGAGAGAQREPRAVHGHLRGRRDGVRDAGRAAAVRKRQHADGGALRPRPSAAAAADRPRAGGARLAARLGRLAARQGAGGPPGVGRAGVGGARGDRRRGARPLLAEVRGRHPRARADHDRPDHRGADHAADADARRRAGPRSEAQQAPEAAGTARRRALGARRRCRRGVRAPGVRPCASAAAGRGPVRLRRRPPAGDRRGHAGIGATRERPSRRSRSSSTAATAATSPR